MVKKLLYIIIPIIILTAVYFTAIKQRDIKVNPEQIPQSPEEYNRTIDESTINLIQFDNKFIFTKKATITTNAGTIKIGLYPDLAPKACENFIGLVEQGYYNGLAISKIIPNYMIQMGDPNDGTGGRSIWNKSFPTEVSLDLWNFKGAIGMASSDIDKNGSQFYIICASTLKDETLKEMENANFPSKVIYKYKEKGGAPWLDGKHTVFGQVISGMEIVEKIAKQNADKDYNPTDEIIIEEITIE